MSTIDGLQRQVAQIAEQIPAPAGPLNMQTAVDFSLFSEGEQQTLRTFLAGLEHYLEGCTIWPHFLAKLSDAELDALEPWVQLAETRAADLARK
jgi:hypothetical protein